MAIETVLRCVPQFITEYFHSVVDMQAFWCFFQSDPCVLQVVDVNDTFHLVVNHFRLTSAGRLNDVLRHESEDTVTDLSEFSFRLSRRSRNPCHWSTLLSTASKRCSPPACISDPAPATTLGMMTLPLTH